MTANKQGAQAKAAAPDVSPATSNGDPAQSPVPALEASPSLAAGNAQPVDLPTAPAVDENAASLEADLGPAPTTSAIDQGVSETPDDFHAPDGDLLGALSPDRPVFAQTYDPAVRVERGIDDLADGYTIPTRVILPQDREMNHGDARFEGGGDPYPMFGDPSRETKLTQPALKE